MASELNSGRSICPKCGGVMNYQVNTVSLNKNRHGLIYWVLIGWWLHPLLYFFATIPMILWRIIHPNRKQSSKTKTFGVCQSCGYTITK